MRENEEKRSVESYDLQIGRFLNEDTYYGDGLNLYAYCGNNPVDYVDPNGHWRTICDKKYGELKQKEANGEKLSVKEKGQIARYEYAQKRRQQRQSNDGSHRNSKNNTSPNHVYVIVDDKGNMIKVGVSGQPLNVDKTSPRANPQVNKINKDFENNKSNRRANAVVVESGLTRKQALELEQRITDKHASRNNGKMPSNYHKRPLPKAKSIKQYVDRYGESPNKSLGGRY